MDESFQLRSRRLLDRRQPAALDFSVLAAGLVSQQATSPAARAQARCAAAADAARSDPLTEILLCGPAWQSAASAQQGCFNRAEVKRRRNMP